MGVGGEFLALSSAPASTRMSTRTLTRVKLAVKGSQLRLRIAVIVFVRDELRVSDREQGLDFLTSPLRAAPWMGLAIAAEVKCSPRRESGMRAWRGRCCE